MHPAKHLSFLVPVVLCCLLIACTTIPETGKSALILVSPQQEMQLGMTSFDQLKKQTPVSQDPKGNQMLQSAGKRLAGVTGMPNAQWEFVLFEDKTPNAFALPGGKVGFNTGIMPICQDEEGVAVVMSHEIAHVTLRHGAQRLSQGMLSEMGRNALSLALYDNPYQTQQLANMAYGAGNTVFVELPYSRDMELEADRIGLRYLKRAGYRPEAAVEFWKRFAAHNAATGGGSKAGLSEYFSTHPVDQRRIAQLEEIIKSGNY